MDQILVAGIGNDADDFGTGRRVGQAVVNIPLDVSLVDEVTVAKLAVTDMALFMRRMRQRSDVGSIEIDQRTIFRTGPVEIRGFTDQWLFRSIGGWM